MRISRSGRRKILMLFAGVLSASVFWYFWGDSVYRLHPVKQRYLQAGEIYPTVPKQTLSPLEMQKVKAVAAVLKDLAGNALRADDRDLPLQLKFTGLPPSEVLTVCAAAEAELPQLDFYIKPAELFADEQARRRVRAREDYDSSQILEIICRESPPTGEFTLEAKLHLIDFNYAYMLRRSGHSTIITCTPHRICAAAE